MLEALQSPCCHAYVVFLVLYWVYVEYVAKPRKRKV
jgi:hypothetical protein